MTNKIEEFSKRSTPQTYHLKPQAPPPKSLRRHIKDELRKRGAVAYNMWLPETNYLPHLLHKEEHIMGSVYGRYDDGPEKKGRGVLIATDQRVLFLDRKPLYIHCDELTFMIIGGVTYTRTAIIGYVTLHTRLGDYRLRTFNLKNAANFVDYIEAKCLQKAEDSEQDKFDAVT